jgi:DNA-binding MarR family transcriptional regulator
VLVDLDRSFGFLVNDVARLLGRRFSHNGRRLGLTRAQCRTLARIARHEGINQAGLADLLEVRPMTLVRQIDRMEDSGWIERRPDPADRRARRLFLTDKARPILGRIRAVANETRDEALTRLSAPEQAQLIALLTRVHATLSERVPADASEDRAGLAGQKQPAGAPIGRIRTALDPARLFHAVDLADQGHRPDFENVGEAGLIDALVAGEIAQRAALRPRQPEAFPVMRKTAPEQARDIVHEKPETAIEIQCPPRNFGHGAANRSLG